MHLFRLKCLIRLGEGGLNPITPEQEYIDSLKASSDLQGPVTYNAQDSIVFDVKKRSLYLYESSTLQYDEIELQAKASSRRDGQTNLVCPWGQR